MKILFYNYRLKRAIRKANQLHTLTGYKYLVLLTKNKIKVIKKTSLKKLIQRKVFAKGTTIQDLEKIALYITY